MSGRSSDLHQHPPAKGTRKSLSALLLHANYSNYVKQARQVGGETRRWLAWAAGLKQFCAF